MVPLMAKMVLPVIVWRIRLSGPFLMLNWSYPNHLECNMVSTLISTLQNTPYASYTYAYPHKTAYRTFERPIPLHDVWRDEKRDAAFLYLHIPFCEMRCGF